MRYLLFLICLWAGAAGAQTYPEYTSTTVNDLAEVLSAAEEAALGRELSALRQDTGVEMTVLTLKTQADYAPNMTMEQFATGLFNHWGIGDAARNDGVLVMVITADRVMRVELGAGFARDWDRAAERVIDDHFLDAFAAGDFPRGLKEGSAAVIREIVYPFLEGEPARDGKRDDGWLIVVFALLAVCVTMRQWLGDFFARFRSCPQCGQRGLRQKRRTTRSASRTSSGRGRKDVHCTHCDYQDSSSYMIPRLSSKSSGGFGGGSSGGGGGSGRF